MRRLLAGTFLAGAPICPLSNLTGEGFEGFFDELNRVVDGCDDRPCGGLFRLWVEDVFTIRGSGTVITGIPSSGLVRAGDRLHLLPGGLPGHVRRMQVYGEEAAEARAGECVALNLPELDHEAVRRGQVLLASDAFAPGTMAEAELRTLTSLKGRIKDYLEVHLHVGTASTQARVAMLEHLEMGAGEAQMVQLRLAEPLALAPGDRFVIRAGAAGGTGLATLGGGRILGTSGARLRRQKPWTLQALAARREAVDDPRRWIELMLRESRAPLAAEELRSRCLLTQPEIGETLSRLRADGRIQPTPGGAFLHQQAIEEAARRLLAALQAFHAANPQRAGAEREELFTALGDNPVVLNMAAQSLLQTKKIVLTGTVLSLAGWTAQVTDRDTLLCDRICKCPGKGRLGAPRLGGTGRRLRRIGAACGEDDAFVDGAGAARPSR